MREVFRFQAFFLQPILKILLILSSPLLDRYRNSLK